ncbi:MAG: S-methyl-5-thioribose-1-phosphate isomerase [Deltaproteobacteria bacterium]|nr:S-methyl-5-thioribose-1-phosphate isomerase [Deltaproteobacteria bacterium]
MVPTLEFKSGALLLLDQRVLPHTVTFVSVQTARACAEAIRDMAVRGAPAIGCAAAYGLALGAFEAAREGSAEAQEGVFQAAHEVLANSRPTAVNLRWALERLSKLRARLVVEGMPAGQIAERLLAEAHAVTEEDLASCKAIGQHGAPLVPDGKGILTHCNAGGLATAGYGTALGVVRAVVASGKQCPVFADETRPWLQGARLTTWELLQDGIPVTLLPDVAAPSLLRSGKIGCVIVGADRIAANGDVANKVGTYGVALAAHAHGVPVMVAAPWSTIDLRAKDGRDIPIEERPSTEVTHVGKARIAAEGVSVFNPAFDVTPAALVSYIVTERGVARAPFSDSLAAQGRLG